MRISNKLRALLIVVVSIVAIAVALPVMSEMVHAEDCTITFHENKGTDPETDPELTYPQTVTVGTSTVLDQNTFDREDYVFVCWNTAADGSGTDYADGAPYTADSSTPVHLYAQWTPKVTITFNANYTSDTGEDVPGPVNQTVGAGIQTTLNANTFTRSGYQFDGWNTALDGSGTLYADGAVVKVGESGLTLFAQWKKEITITFHANNGIDPEVTYTQNALEGEVTLDAISSFTPSFTVPADKVFACWTWNKDIMTKYCLDNTTITLSDSVDLYAHWEEPCTITFVPGAGTGASYTQVIPQNLNTALDKYNNQFTAPEQHKVFAGWSDSSTVGEGNIYDDNAWILSAESTMTLYAQWKWEQFEVTTNAATVTNGTITSTKKYDYNTDVTITAEPAEGYQVSKWTVDGTDITTNATTYTFEGISGDHTVSVEFELKTYKVETSVVRPDGITDGSITGTVTAADHGSDVELTATAPTGCYVEKWIDNGIEVSDSKDKTTYTISNITADHTVQVVFKRNVYTVTVDITPYEGGDYGIDGTCEYGTKVTLTAKPNPGYHVSQIIAGGVTTTYTELDITENKTVTVSDSIDADCTVSVVFALNEYTVTTNFDSVEHGTITETKKYQYGDPVTLTASPETGYHVSTVTIDSDTNSYTTADQTEDKEIVVSSSIASNYTVSVGFEINTYTVTATDSPSAYGTASVEGSREHGTAVSLKVSPESGYHVTSVILDGTSVWTNSTVNATEEFTVPLIASIDGNHSVTVEYEINTYVVNTGVLNTVGDSDPAIGTISVSGSLNHGTDAVFTASPAVGYHLDRWIDNGTEIKAEELENALEYTISGIGKDHTVYVVYAINPYDIGVSSAGHGEVKGKGTYNHFDTCTIEATPDTGYHFVNWTDAVTGNQVSNSATYSFTVEGARDIVANFAINKYTISLVPVENGEVKGAGDYFYLDEVTLKATPNEGYHFVGWVENGTLVSDKETYTFTATGNRKLEAVFEVNMYTVTYLDDDGTILQQSEFAWGTNAYFQKATPTKAPTAQYTYKFAGWDNKVTRVTDDVTYTAVYDKTVNQYTVTFVNADGKVLQTGLVDYGAMPTYDGETPVKAATVEYTYTFAGWDKEITKVQGDITYTATYSEKKFEKGDIDYVYFKVMFNSNGGSDVVTQLVQDGYTATIPDDPMRERYNFAGWYLDEDLTKPFSFSTPITSDITLYAKWVKGVQEVTVTYAVVGDGTVKWEAGSSEGVVITVDRSQDNDTGAEHFKSIQIDGEEVAYFNYEVSEGSATITLSTDILKDMAPGTYKVTILFDDGQAEVDLVIEGGETPTEEVTETPTEAGDPATGDDGGNTTGPNYIGLWIALGVVALVCIAAAPILIIKRRGVK